MHCNRSSDQNLYGEMGHQTSAPFFLTRRLFLVLSASFITGCLVSADAISMWVRSTKNTDWSNGPLACPFARSLALLTCSLAPHYSLRSRAPLRSLPRSLAHCAHPLACGTVRLDGYLFWAIVQRHFRLRFIGMESGEWIPRPPTSAF